MTDQLLTERRGQTLLLTLDRPERENRITGAMCRTIIDAIGKARSTGCRSIVITGTGDCFSKGGDFASEGNVTEAYLVFSKAFADLNHAILQSPVPVLAAVNGDAHAGGFSFLTASDIAIAEDGATFALPELLHGLFPLLAMATVQRTVPRKIFFDMVYRGRELTAGEAMDFGLVNEVVPKGRALARTLEIAGTLDSLDPTAIRIGRQSYHTMSAMTADAAVEHARYVLPTLLAAVGKDELSKEKDEEKEHDDDNRS